jgi:hypothetical protein
LRGEVKCDEILQELCDGLDCYVRNFCLDRTGKLFDEAKVILLMKFKVPLHIVIINKRAES